jgi:HK97 family phage major capsid protein
MTTLRALLEQRTKITTEMNGINNAAGENPLAPEVDARFNALRADLDTINARIDRQAFLEDAERRMAGQPHPGTGDRNLDRELRAFSLVRAIAHQAGLPVDAGREIEVSRELASRAGRPFQGMAVPMSVFHEPVEQRVITTAAPAGGPGSNIIATDYLGNQFIDLLRNELVIRRAGARVLSGLIGNADIPATKTSATAAWVNENAAITATDHEFRKVSLTPKHVGALVEYSRNMLLQTSPDVESLLRTDLAATLAVAIESGAINGSGSAPNPRGVLNVSGIGDVAMGTDGGGISWAKVIDLIGEVLQDNAEGTAFITNAKVLKAGRKTPRVSGNPLMIWEERAQLADYPAFITNAVPSNLTKGSSGAVCSALIFGNWSELLLGYWSELDVLVNPYETTAYSKGNVQVRAMATMDVAVRHAESFGAIKDLTTA